MTWLRDFAIGYETTGNVSLTAELLGVHRNSVYRHLARDEHFRREIEAVRERRQAPKDRKPAAR